MRKAIFVFALVFASFLMLASPSYALLCTQGQGVDEGDQCWTKVRIAAGETYVVSAGSILVHDFTNADTSEKAAAWARVSTSSNDDYRVIGVAQSVIATGQEGMVLVHGKGKICVRATVSTITTGDRLYVSSAHGKAGISRGADTPETIASGVVIAFALETKPTAGVNGTTMDAYITALN